MALLFKNLLFTLLVPGTIAVYLPCMIFADGEAGHRALFLPIAAFTVGAGIYAWCVWDFAMAGRGTPAPFDAPKTLIVRGLYRYVRNPMYLAVLMVIMGWAFLYRSPLLLAYAGVVATAFHLFIVFYEEPHLEGLFGQAYADYRARVPRWLPGRRFPA